MDLQCPIKAVTINQYEPVPYMYYLPPRSSVNLCPTWMHWLILGSIRADKLFVVILLISSITNH